MILINKKDVPIFQFPHFIKFTGIEHGILTRNGGNSPEPYNTLNLSFGVGDRDDHVKSNREKLSSCFYGKDFLFLKQVHGSNVLSLKKESTKSHVFQNRKDPLIADAAVTNIRGLILTIQVADCQSVLLYDPTKEVVANIHSGWRGSIQNIIRRTVKVMEKVFNCCPSDIKAGVGPSLGPCCGEFVNYKKEIPQSMWKYKDKGYNFNFWNISRDQLVDTGVLPENIKISNICTSCNGDTFFSYRSQKTTGRFATVIGLKASSKRKTPLIIIAKNNYRLT